MLQCVLLKSIFEHDFHSVALHYVFADICMPEGTFEDVDVEVMSLNNLKQIVYWCVSHL